MTESQIKQKIDRLKKIVAKTDNPQTKKDMEGGIKKLEAQLKEMGKKEEKPKPKPKPKPETKKEEKPKPKPKPKPQTKKVEKPKTETKKTGKKGVQMLSTKTALVDGKEMKLDSQEFCDYLLDEFKQRRAKAEERKATKSKTKTKSVMAKVTDNIEKGISQAIKQSVKTQKKQIEKDPRKFFSKVKELEGATKTFLQKLKNVLGREYEAKEVTSTIKGIQELVDELKKKVEK